MAKVFKLSTNQFNPSLSTTENPPTLPNSAQNREGTNGGRPSNRPPVKVNINYFKSCKILASGIDTLYLSLSVRWRHINLFEYLAELKEKAKASNDIVQGILKPNNDCAPWKFTIRPNGIRAYTWLLDGKDYFLKIFNSVKPAQRPSIMIEIRSETLWANGPVHSVEYILDVLEGVGADIIGIKPSRIDLCTDILLDAKLWTPEIKDVAVTRAN